MNHSLYCRRRTAGVHPKRDYAPPEMAGQVFARYSYCLPASSEQPAGTVPTRSPGRPRPIYCASAPGRARTRTGQCHPGPGGQQCTYVHGRSTQAGLCVCFPWPCWLLLLAIVMRGPKARARPGRGAGDGQASGAGPWLPTSVVSSTSPSLLNLSAESNRSWPKDIIINKWVFLASDPHKQNDPNDYA